MTEYQEFLSSKQQEGSFQGFEPIYIPGWMFPFQQSLTDWSIRKGKSANFSDCFLPGSMILADGEYRPIETCHEGMKIETLAGPSSIERTMSRLYRGEVIKLVTGSGFHAVSVTPNHKFYVLRRKRCVHPSRSNTLCSPDCNTNCPVTGSEPYSNTKIELVQASELTLDDCLLFRQARELRGTITKTEALLTLVGFWLAEGWIGRKDGVAYTTSFGFDLAEEHTFVAELRQAIDRLGMKHSVGRHKEGKNVLVVSISNKGLAHMLSEECGERSHGKHLPAWTKHLNSDQQCILLTALFKGDGQILLNPKSTSGRLSENIKFTTVSYQLAAGVRDALLGMGIRCAAMKEPAKTDKKGLSHKEVYRIQIPRRFMVKFGFPVEVIRRDLKQTEHAENGQRYTLIPIRQISRHMFSGEVYNLTSAGHDSYLTDAGTSKNCGMGKTAMELVWADNVVRKTNKPVLDLTPLAVAQQTIREAEKFGIEAYRSNDGTAKAITVTNYEKLHHFNPDDFAGVVCDESSCIKAFNGKRRAQVTEFLRTIPYRLLCTATAAPNDYIELGTSSEALGVMGQMDMLNRFFKNDQNTSDTSGKWRGHAAPRQFQGPGWRFKGHAETPFWRWVCGWARACRKPSDLGFEDDRFVLPELIEQEHIVDTKTLAPGMLFPMPASNMREEREERRRTIKERCEKAAELANTKKPVVIWCHLNDEGDFLEQEILGSKQVSGSDSDEEKEETYEAFSTGQLRALVIKPRIGAWGVNWQHCNHTITFASHSFEQYYQQIRRFWRFGQKQAVTVDLIATEGERGAKENMQRKAEQADRMFSLLVDHMNQAIRIESGVSYNERAEVPSWL